MTTSLFSSILPGNGPAFGDDDGDDGEEISDSYRGDATAQSATPEGAEGEGHV